MLTLIFFCDSEFRIESGQWTSCCFPGFLSNDLNLEIPWGFLAYKELTTHFEIWESIVPSSDVQETHNRTDSLFQKPSHLYLIRKTSTRLEAWSHHQEDTVVLWGSRSAHSLIFLRLVPSLGSLWPQFLLAFCVCSLVTFKHCCHWSHDWVKPFCTGNRNWNPTTQLEKPKSKYSVCP